MECNTNITQFLQTKSKMIVIIASAMVILGIFSTNEANAIFFDQNLRIHVDKGPYSLGDYGAIITDLDTGVKAKNYYTDSVNSPQNIVIPGHINTYDGDRLQACVMKMSTNEITCQEGTANSLYGLDFYLDMANAVVVNQ